MRWRRILFIAVSVLFYSSVQAQPCIIPITNNIIEVGPAVCVNTVATLRGFTPFGGTGTYSYQWEKAVGNCGNGNFLPIAGATTRDYAVPAGTDPNDCFRRVIRSGTCVSNSNSLRVALSERTTPAPPSTTSVNSSCIMASGIITVTDPDPAIGISYSIDGITYTNTTGIFTGLSPAIYSVTAKYPAGCISPLKSVTISSNPPVNETISPASATICAGSSQVLTMSGNNSYQWYRNDTLIPGTTNKTYTATLAGTYHTIITVGICTARSSNNSVITGTPLPTGSISPASGIICANNPILLTTSGGTSYQWFRNATAISGATSATYNVTTPGTYTVSIRSGNCSNMANNPAVITQGVIPSGFITPASGALCPGGQVPLTVTTASGVNSYQWFRTGNLISGATNATYIATQTGTYSVIISNGTCDGVGSNIVTVSQSLPITFTTTPTNPNCTSATGSINVSGVSGGGSSNYLYSKDNGATFQTGSIFTNLTAGNYQVVVKDTAGCISNPKPVIIQSFTSTLSGTATTVAARCGEPSGSVTIQPTGGTPGYTYRLDNGSYQPTNSFSNIAAGNHTVTLRDQPGCTFNVNFVINQASSNPNLVIKPAIICPGFTANLKDPSVTAGSDAGLLFTYHTDTAATISLPNPGAVDTGIYYIKANNAAGCFTIKPVAVIRQTQGCVFDVKVFVPTAFTPNANNANDVLRPIFYNVAELRYFKVYNRWGQEVFKTATMGTGWDGTIKGIRQPSETYSWILECIGKNGEIIKESGRSLLIR